MQYAIVPIELQCSPNEMTTVHGIFTKWKDWDRKISNDIQSIITENLTEGIQELKSDAEKFISSFPDVKDGYIKLKDFLLVYSYSEIENGRFWNWHGSRFLNLGNKN